MKNTTTPSSTLALARLAHEAAYKAAEDSEVAAYKAASDTRIDALLLANATRQAATDAADLVFAEVKAKYSFG